MIILDSNVISEVMRPDPDQVALTWIDDQLAHELYLTTITLAEVRYGIAVLPAGRRRDRLSELFEERLMPQFHERVLAFDEPASVVYASLMARARGRGRAISQSDGLIAAIAVANRAVVATRDVAPFEAADLPVVNPFAQP
ncbi:MAG: type II toxin-antitoxin system VapC family toxin [Aeromicrobium sp.]|uniref:type II toxin-antitoxin system VapC family toxin n=1 Tax=Aeromicrobium sp. TaxID=1871063 RepID=UPI0039E67CFB